VVQSENVGTREVMDMRAFFPAVVGACHLLGGCTGLDEAVDVSGQYSGTPVVRYDNDGGSWRISDKPNEGRLKIGPSLAGSFGAAFGRVVTFTPLPKDEYQETVEDWLSSTGRRCTVTDGYLLIDPQWEFKYACR
jgi:hypothetical protein